MSEVVPFRQIAPMTEEAVEQVRLIERASLASQVQIDIATEHHFHAGIYARTVKIPAGALITGVQIKIDTILILSGDATLFVGKNDTVRLTGYHVLPAAAGRKQAFIAHADTYLTMLFPSRARWPEEAEAEFTDEPDMLASRRDR